MGRVLGIVYRTIATHLAHKAGYTNSRAHTGAVTLIQRFGQVRVFQLFFVWVIMNQCEREILLIVLQAMQIFS